MMVASLLLHRLSLAQIPKPAFLLTYFTTSLTLTGLTDLTVNTNQLTTHFAIYHFENKTLTYSIANFQ